MWGWQPTGIVVFYDSKDHLVKDYKEIMENYDN